VGGYGSGVAGVSLGGWVGDGGVDRRLSTRSGYSPDSGTDTLGSGGVPRSADKVFGGWTGCATILSEDP